MFCLYTLVDPSLITVFFDGIFKVCIKYLLINSLVALFKTTLYKKLGITFKNFIAYSQLSEATRVDNLVIRAEQYCNSSARCIIQKNIMIITVFIMLVTLVGVIVLLDCFFLLQLFGFANTRLLSPVIAISHDLFNLLASKELPDTINAAVISISILFLPWNLDDTGIMSFQYCSITKILPSFISYSPNVIGYMMQKNCFKHCMSE